LLLLDSSADTKRMEPN